LEGIWNLTVLPVWVAAICMPLPTYKATWEMYRSHHEVVEATWECPGLSRVG
jgi:hypothetical protein